MTMSKARRGALAAAILGCAAASAFFLLRGRTEEHIVPQIDTSRASPRLAAAIEQARRQVESNRSSSAAWGRLGMLAMAHHYRPQARICFAEAARLAPRQFRWPYLAGVLEEETDLAGAIRSFESAAALSPDYVPLRLRLARAHIRLNRLEDADRELRQAAELAPESPFPMTARGRLALAQGDLAAARDHFAAAVKIASWSREARLGLAQSLHRLGQVTQAYREQQTAQRLPAMAAEPPDPVLQEIEEQELTGRRLSMQADEAIARGDVAAAVRALREVVRARPDLSRPLLNLGQLLEGQGQLREALDVFEEAVTRFPREPLAHFSLGTALELAGRHDEALAAYRQAGTLKPDYADAHYCLGLLLRKRQELSASADALRRAASSNPGFAPAHVALGMVLADLGDRHGSVAQLRLAAKLAPDDAELREQLERLLRASDAPTDAHRTNGE